MLTQRHPFVESLFHLCHTVILRPHPSLIGKTVWFADGETRRSIHDLQEHRFLVADFLRLFTPENALRRSVVRKSSGCSIDSVRCRRR